MEDQQRLRELQQLLDGKVIPNLPPEKASELIMLQMQRIWEKQAETDIQNILSGSGKQLKNTQTPQSNEQKLNSLKQLCALGYSPQSAWNLIISGVDLSALNNISIGGTTQVQSPSPIPITQSPSQWSTVSVGHQILPQSTTSTPNLPPTEKFFLTPQETCNLEEESATQRGWLVVIGVIIVCVVTAFAVNFGVLQSIQNFFGNNLYTPSTKPESNLSTKKLAAAPQKGDTIGEFQVTSGYGWRTHPILKIPKFHFGIDVGLPSGYPYRMPGAKGSKGTVKCTFDAGSGFVALVVSEDPRYQNIQLAVCHMQANSCIPGPHSSGSIFGKAGSTGLSNGVHMHLGVKVNGRRVAPSRTFIEEILNVSPTKNA